MFKHFSAENLLYLLFEKKNSPKTHRAAQTVRPRDLKLGQMVGHTFGENLSEYDPDWPIGGATATKSTKLPITPRPFDLESRFLHHCDPWLTTDKMYISDSRFEQKKICYGQFCPKPTFAN